MTADEFSAKLGRKISEIKEANDKSVRMAALSTNALVSKRVYEGGYLSSERKAYKSKAYIQKRKKRGFEVNFVNLTFEGTLKKDTENSVTQIREGVYAAGIKNQGNVEKLEAINRRYYKPFTLTESETKAFHTAQQHEFKRFINE